ncbi:MBL fold metallo-hydrolase [Streptomyces sp. NRRL S-87]|uniref:MBL fold metallo-hydrolase n=1 Tax=Streptomyces sp. NRRL S-87 TaxID=1463920 RepID=UPI0004BF7A79|nr:MBL fold metallo-hydrolase [Streptomyces sp. NRRL S-87]
MSVSVDEPYTVELGPGVYAYVQPDGGWCLSNAGIVTGGGRTLLVDTAATERRARWLREAVAAVGAPAPATIVNTHHHGDHTYGNCLFPEATVVGHDNSRAEQLDAGHQLHLIWPQTDFGDIRITAPGLTYSDSLTLHVGDTEVKVFHPGVAHTTGDSVVWLPRERVVFTGDLVFSGGTPFVPFGSVSGSLRALELLRELGAETVVPGHGPITDGSAYDDMERYLRYVGRLAEDGRAKGLTPLEAARQADLGEFAEWRESERLVANLHRAYADLEGLPGGSPLNLLTLVGDMTAMNGGVMVACHA